MLFHSLWTRFQAEVYRLCKCVLQETMNSRLFILTDEFEPTWKNFCWYVLAFLSISVEGMEMMMLFSPAHFVASAAFEVSYTWCLILGHFHRKQMHPYHFPIRRPLCPCFSCLYNGSDLQVTSGILELPPHCQCVASPPRCIRMAQVLWVCHTHLRIIPVWRTM